MQMTFLATLPSHRFEPAVHVFRCDGCDRVASDPM
jgi:hypothetical protein